MKTTIFLLVLVTIILSSCKADNPVTVKDSSLVYWTEIWTLSPNNWLRDSKHFDQWYQSFALDKSYGVNFDYVGVLCYYINEYGAWEPLPSTRIFYTSNGVPYSDEIWFSYDNKDIFIDYRNTFPTNPTSPKDPLKVKVVYFDKFNTNIEILKKVINTNN